MAPDGAVLHEQRNLHEPVLAKRNDRRLHRPWRRDTEDSGVSHGWSQLGGAVFTDRRRALDVRDTVHGRGPQRQERQRQLHRQHEPEPPRRPSDRRREPHAPQVRRRNALFPAGVRGRLARALGSRADRHSGGARKDARRHGGGQWVSRNLDEPICLRHPLGQRLVRFRADEGVPLGRHQRDAAARADQSGVLRPLRRRDGLPASEGHHVAPVFRRLQQTRELARAGLARRRQVFSICDCALPGLPEPHLGYREGDISLRCVVHSGAGRARQEQRRLPASPYDPRTHQRRRSQRPEFTGST